jgi:hypothetical protein
MKTNVTVVRLGEEIEEETVVRVGAWELTCFLSYCPRAIACGESYEGELSLWAADGLELREAEGESTGITRLGDGFRYRVVGILRDSVLDAGVRFEDDVFSSEYKYLDGQTVAVEADRIHLAID